MKGKQMFGLLTIVMVLAVFAALTPAAAADTLSGDRTISPTSVNAEDTFRVTVVVTIDGTVYGPVLNEAVPDGWTVTEVDNAGASYSAAETKWVWLDEVTGTKTVIYDVTVPAGTATGNYPVTGTVLATVGGSTVGPFDVTGANQVTVTECTCDFCLDLDAGWNFVSVPRTLNGSNDANTVFNLVSGETCLYYDCVDGWKSNSAVSVVPCQGYWVGKVASDQICLDFDPGTGSNNPPEQELCQGWNMVGHIHTNSMSVGEFASATTLGDNIAQIWQWDQTNGWEGYPFGDFADMTPGRGYWILVGEEDTMYGTI